MRPIGGLLTRVARNLNVNFARAQLSECTARDHPSDFE